MLCSLCCDTGWCLIVIGVVVVIGVVTGIFLMICLGIDVFVVVVVCCHCHLNYDLNILHWYHHKRDQSYKAKDEIGCGNVYPKL